MRHGRHSIPFAEQGGKLRGLLDLATGRYPGFLFGGAVGSLLPVFHFHEVTPATLEPKLRYLAENDYRTVGTDAIARLVRGGVHPGPRRVALCFDDALSSVWSVAGPLLRRHGLTGITYAIPGRLAEASAPRPTVESGPIDPAAIDGSPAPFVTWPELKALHDSGVVEVQSHTWSHSMIFSAPGPVDFVTPAHAAMPLLERPLIDRNGQPVYLGPADLGAPLYPGRSRMSDATWFLDDPEARERCVNLVRSRGGAPFFARPGWRRELRALAASPGTFEPPDRREAAIRDELARARAVLADRLRTTAIRHLCFPWGVAGAVAREAARDLGFETAFSERLFGLRAVRAGDDPLRLMRLNSKFILCLPGRGRRFFLPGRPLDAGGPPAAAGPP